MIVVSPPWNRGVFTHPASRRLRFPFGRRLASPLPWICTRAEMMAGPFLEWEDPYGWLAETPKAKDWIGGDEDPEAVKMRFVPGIGYTNARQGWSPSGEVLA